MRVGSDGTQKVTNFSGLRRVSPVFLVRFAEFYLGFILFFWSDFFEFGWALHELDGLVWPVEGGSGFRRVELTQFFVFEKHSRNPSLAHGSDGPRIRRILPPDRDGSDYEVEFDESDMIGRVF
jgi:hypothetical protein